MARVITFSRKFPAYHPEKGEPTYFVEKIHNWWWDNANDGQASMTDLLFDLNKDKNEVLIQNFVDSLDEDGGRGFNEKHHTIRGGHRWKPGDKFSPRVWSGIPYNSPQIIIAPDIEVVKTWDFKIAKSAGGIDSIWVGEEWVYCNEEGSESYIHMIESVAKNDGLSLKDLLAWFQFPNPFDGQIICWSPTVNY